LAIVEYHKKRGAMEVDPDFALRHVRAGADQVVRELQAALYKLLWRTCSLKAVKSGYMGARVQQDPEY
jgi:hypothetical protein